MATLRIPITSVPESGVAISVDFEPCDVQPANTEAIPLVKGSLEGMLSEVGGEYLFTGQVEGAYVHACDRCLEDARADVVTPVTWFFALGPEEAPVLWTGDDDDEASPEEADDVQRPINNGVIDLAPVVWEELVVAAPSKYICSEDCKGLCSRCGTNLNEGTCGCGPKEVEVKSGHQGFAKLAELYPELMNKPTEE